jgi:hypothetical protein
MPSAVGSVADVLSDLARALRTLKVPWYVFGAHALVLRGCPRATADLDVTVLLGTIPTSRLMTALRKSGFASRSQDDDFVAATCVLPVFHRPTVFPVDIVLGGPGLEERFASAAQAVRIGRLTVPVATCAHLVLMKVLAARPKDLQDAATLLDVRRNEIDDAELDELTRAMADALAEDDILSNLSGI